MRLNIPILSGRAAGWLTLTVGCGLIAAGPAALRPELAPVIGVPLAFEAAQSTGDCRQFTAHGTLHNFTIEAGTVRMVTGRPALTAPLSPMDLKGRGEFAGTPGGAMTMSFLGASADAHLTGEARLASKINYLVGSADHWRSGIPLYERVRVEGLYPGTDLVYYGNQQQLEYDFTLRPGADPDAIRVRFSGVDHLAITTEGEVEFSIGGETIRHAKPVLYQPSPQGRKAVSGGYRMRDAATIGFDVGKYDPSLPLIIDPVLSYSRLFGGNAGDTALAVKLDSQGSIYIAGQTVSTSWVPQPGSSGLETNFQGGKVTGDAFIAKFDNSGSNMVYFTYLGGQSDDAAYDLAVDDGGRVFVTGFTDSPDFPVMPRGVGVPGLGSHIGGVFDPLYGSYPLDGFVALVTPDGAGLVYSTFLGGNNADTVGGIAIDEAGAAYVTGYTYSTDFPVMNPLLIPGTTNYMNHIQGSNDVFVTKIAPNGASLAYSTYLGGVRDDNAAGIAVAGDGSAFIAGYTASTNFPVTPDAVQKSINRSTNAVAQYEKKSPIPYDAFLAHLSPDGSSLMYSTYFGGTNNDAAFRVRLDNSGNAYLTGSSVSHDFANGFEGVITNGASGTAGNTDAFLAKFDPAGQLVYAGTFGTENNDVGWDLAVNPVSMEAFVVGIAGRTNFPVANDAGFSGPPKSKKNPLSTFVTAFNAEGSQVLYSVLLRGTKDDLGYGIALDPANNAYVIGRTGSSDFPSVGPVSSLQGTNDSFLAKISMEPLLEVNQATNAVVQLSWKAFSPEYHIETSTNAAFSGQKEQLNLATPVVDGRHTVILSPTNNGVYYRLRKE